MAEARRRVPAQRRYGFAIVNAATGEILDVFWTRKDARVIAESMRDGKLVPRVDRVRVVPCATS